MDAAMIQTEHCLFLEQLSGVDIGPFMHQNGLPLSVILLSKLACALGHGGGGGGGGHPPGSHPHRQRYGSKCVCVGSAAVVLLDTQQAAGTLLGRSATEARFNVSWGGMGGGRRGGQVNGALAVQAALSQVKKINKKEKTINTCETRAIYRKLFVQR